MIYGSKAAWYLPFCWYKTIGTLSALEKETGLILYATYFFLSCLSENHEHLPVPAVIPVICSQTRGRMDVEHSTWDMLLRMVLKLRKTNFFSDWGNNNKGEEWGETPAVNCWTILLDTSMWQSARCSVSETPSQPGPCCCWAELVAGIKNQKSYNWFWHTDMIPKLVLHLGIWEPLHHTLLYGKDRTMADWLPGALPGAPTAQFSDTFTLKTHLSSSIVRLFLE